MEHWLNLDNLFLMIWHTVLHNIKNMGFEIGIVGGGTKSKILSQLNDLYFRYYFFECGCVYYINNSIDCNELDITNIYNKNIRLHKLYDKINLLIKKSLAFISNVPYKITGNFIDLRTGLVYISLIGMSATEEERTQFIKLDKTYNYREQLINILTTEAHKLDINNDISILKGGSVGISIYPKEYDKAQVLDVVSNKFNTIHYFGDKYQSDGNDYHLMWNAQIQPHPVDTPEETLTILTNLYSNFN